MGCLDVLSEICVKLMNNMYNYMAVNRFSITRKFKSWRRESTYGLSWCAYKWVVLMCFPKLEYVWNLDWQYAQLYGRSPVWYLRWTVRPPFRRKPFLHISHMKCLTPWWNASCAFIPDRVQKSLRQFL